MIDCDFRCPQCRKELQPKDWTCLFCGAIVARYLFTTISLKSLEGRARDAYQTGYQECSKQFGQTGSPVIRRENYRPTPGNEAVYRAGWQAAADKFNAKADRKFGRRRGLKVLGSGVAFMLLGLAIVVGTAAVTDDKFTLVELAPFGLGAANIVIGIGMIVTGSNDEARPEP